MSSNELHELLTELVRSWPSEHSSPAIERAREYLEIHHQVTEDQEQYHQLTSYDGWKTSSSEVWYSL